MTKKNAMNSTLTKVMGTTGILILVGLTVGVTLWALITLVRDSLVEVIEGYTAINPLLIIVLLGIIILSVLGYNGRAIIKKAIKR